MISPSDLVSLVKRAGAGGSLAPFFKAVCVYCAVGAADAPPAAGAAAKCAPVVCLALCVLLRTHAEPSRSRYARRVGAGLALSALGDALLVWPQHFVSGMAAFAAAHCCYLAAFPARPLRPLLALACLGAAVGYLSVIGPPRALEWPVRGYALLLGGSAWRGAARPGPARAGALLFLLSDALLGYGLFARALPYQQVLVMSTYYLGQLCIALSALEPPPAPTAPPATASLTEQAGGH